MKEKTGRKHSKMYTAFMSKLYPSVKCDSDFLKSVYIFFKVSPMSTFYFNNQKEPFLKKYKEMNINLIYRTS